MSSRPASSPATGHQEYRDSGQQHPGATIAIDGEARHVVGRESLKGADERPDMMAWTAAIGLSRMQGRDQRPTACQAVPRLHHRLCP
jgi:hypothetical protein